MPEEFDPDWCMRPGVLLRDEMEHWGGSVRMIARVCRVEPEVIQGIIDGTVRIDEKVAHGLSMMGVSAEFWLNFQRIYDAGLAAGKIDISDD